MKEISINENELPIPIRLVGERGTVKEYSLKGQRRGKGFGMVLNEENKNGHNKKK